MTDTRIFVPGDTVDSSLLPPSQKRKIGIGLNQTGPNEFQSTVAGPLEVDFKKKSAQISILDARYIPRAGDLVIAQVRASSTEFFFLYINAHSQQAFLPQLAFEGASKKTRPQLKPNDLVYAKVVFAQKNMDIELSCVNPSTGKAEPDGLGPLTGGMVFDVSIGLAERMLKRNGVEFLEELGAKIPGGFEVCVGKNGRVWVDCPEAGVRGVCAVGRCLAEVDRGSLQAKEQKKLVNRIVHEAGVS
jgi:exosome complex component RRP40